MSPTIDNIFVDVGAKDKADVLAMGIHVGCVITFQDELTTLNDIYYCGRALDNRLGGFCIAEVARLLKEKKKTTILLIYSKCCSRGDWASGCRNDCQHYKTACSHHY